ncbi:hypothetical protein XarbCFBP8150_14990 [Xanthomonas arboricola]|nr:hypothetical protein XarbCFBP8150_14990 [Xanthomonas arboricola]
MRQGARQRVRSARVSLSGCVWRRSTRTAAAANAIHRGGTMTLRMLCQAPCNGAAMSLHAGR